MKSTALATLSRLFGLILLSAIALQLFFATRVAAMRWVDPLSTAFQRSEAWRLLGPAGAASPHLWSHEWVDRRRLSDNLKRAVIASEDAGFTEHSGVEWDALEKAWERNRQAEARVRRINEQLERRLQRRPATATPSRPPAAAVQPRIVGGSTITQQLAKNLFLAGERNLLRKVQEIAITFMLEAFLPKPRILEIYLDSVEWGEGIFGAEAAARHYFHTSAATLSARQAAMLAVMLPAPKRFEKRPQSAYIAARAETIVARMGAVDLP